jgi:hypothetical protein
MEDVGMRRVAFEETLVLREHVSLGATLGFYGLSLEEDLTY